MAKIQGLDHLKSRFRKLPASVFEEVASAIEQASEEIVGMQKRLAPRRTGRLAESIVFSLDGKPPPYAAFRPKGRRKKRAPAERGLLSIITAGNARVRYAHLVEFGTAAHIVGGRFKGARHPGTTARPFFYPAYRALRKRARSKVSRSFSKGIRKSKGK